MSETMTTSNVFYLPAPVTTLEPRRAPSRQAALRAAVARAWRRLRVSVADIRAVWSEREAAAAIGFSPLHDAADEGSGRRLHRGSRSGPARVIIFAEARVRLRPAPRA